MKPCDRVRELLPWYANGTLTSDETREVTAHLAACAACGEELALTLRMKVSVEADVRRLPRLPDSARKRVEASIQGRSIASIDVGSFLLGFTFGARVNQAGVPVQGDLRLLGRKIKLFKVGRESQERRNRHVE